MSVVSRRWFSERDLETLSFENEIIHQQQNIFNTLGVCVCVCVCVQTLVREGERERREFLSKPDFNI